MSLYNLINLRDCLNDTPAFRRQVAQHEDSVNRLENQFKSIHKFMTNVGDVSAQLSEKMGRFTQILNEMSFSTEPQTNHNYFDHTLSHFAIGLNEIERSRDMLNSHIEDVFLNPIDAILKEAVPKIKESKKRFDRSSDEYTSNLSKYLSKREKDAAVDECYNEMSRSKEEFHEITFDYSRELRDFRAHQQMNFMEMVLGLMYTYSSFFHQGYEILKDIEPLMKDVTAQLQEMRTQQQAENDKTEALRNVMLQELTTSTEANSGEFELVNTNSFTNPQSGYLYLKSDQRIFESWARYFFKIDNDRLTYTSRDKPNEAPSSINLKLCTVKLPNNVDRRFCFQLVTNERNYLLQAENEERMRSWVQTLQTAIENSHHYNATSPLPLRNSIQLNDTISESKASNLEIIRSIPGNDKCADCRTEAPTWACINLGIVLCIECSGIHRSLGVHVSKVRSLTLDNWEVSLIEVMKKLGNINVNNILEAKLLESPESSESLLNELDLKPILPNSEQGLKAKYITAKYVQRRFCNFVDDITPNGNEVSENQDAKPESDINMLFWESMEKSDLSAALDALIQGADINFQNPDAEKSSCLHQALKRKDYAGIEFLIMWSSNLNLIDDLGKTPLHYSTYTQNPRLIWFLLKKGADWKIADQNGKTPIDYALDLADVSVVMAFRYYAFLFNSNPGLTEKVNFGFDEALEMFGAVRNPN